MRASSRMGGTGGTGLEPVTRSLSIPAQMRFLRTQAPQESRAGSELPFADPFMVAVQRCSAVGERAQSGADLLPSRPKIADLFG